MLLIVAAGVLNESFCFLNRYSVSNPEIVPVQVSVPIYDIGGVSMQRAMKAEGNQPSQLIDIFVQGPLALPGSSK